MSGLLFELLTSKTCDWSTAELDGTGWVWELQSLTFNGSDWSIAKFDDRGLISEPVSFTFNGNSKCTGFSFFGLYLLNDNLVCVFFKCCGWLHGRLIDFLDEYFLKTLGYHSLFWVLWEFRSTFLLLSPLSYSKWFFSKQAFSQQGKYWEHNGYVER